jgi:glycosyltransferase involved in cell wall biosynthesis
MRDRVLRKGVPVAKAHTVSIWGGRMDANPTRGVNPLTRYLGLEGRFVVMYSGNAGIVHDFGAVFEAMRLLRDDPRIYFLFVGGGPRRAEVEQFAHREGLTNFAYHDYVPRDMLRHSLSVANVHLISLRQRFVGISVPSKLYGAMASSRPILFVGPKRCETADAIRDSRCGVTIDPREGGDVAAGAQVAEVLRAWADVPRVGEELGAHGRCAFVERYDHRLSCAAFERVVRSSWGNLDDTQRREPVTRRLRSRARHARSDPHAKASDPPAAAR